jgi:hypothetical protein
LNTELMVRFETINGSNKGDPIMMRFSKNNDALGTVNRGNPTESSL